MLLRDDHENLLVDFGSDSNCNFIGIAQKIKAACNEIPLSILITHFHEDHINGFLVGALKVSKVYLPDILQMRRYGGKLTFLQLQVLEDIFRCISLNKKLQITLYDLLLKLCNDKSSIYFLQRGNIFTVSQKVYQVLWPPFDNFTIHGRVMHRTLKDLVKLNVLPRSVLGEKGSGRDIPREEFSTNTFSNLEGESALSRIDLNEIDNFIDALLSGYYLAKNQQWDSLNGDLGTLKDKFERLNEYIYNLKDLSGRPVLNDSLRKELGELSASMRKQANKISIVFQDSPNNGTSAILMTGDIPPKELNKVVTAAISSKPEMAHHYTVIKAPHHGTDTYFTPLLPSCDAILISNGVPSKAHRNWGKISYNYGAFYGSHKRCSILCTNRRCELVDLKDVEKCQNCTKNTLVARNITISVI